MRRAVALLAAAALTLLLAAVVATAAPTAPFTVTQAGGARFPERSFVITLPGQATLNRRGVHVTEDGKPVAATAVSFTGAAVQKRFAVELVIDASNSMAGTPINDATAAARTFAESRDPEQPVGVLAFNRKPVTLVAPTRSLPKINRALAQPPPLGRQTYIYDAAGTALTTLRSSGATAGSIIVLSDGRDTGSRLTASDLALQARLAGVRIFTIGLHSGAYDASALRKLAKTTGGTFTAASSSSQLNSIYKHLSSQIANQYLLTYRSLAKAHDRVHVSVSIDGMPGVATADYISPALPGAFGEVHTATSFWHSTSAMLLVVLICALLVAYIVSVIAQRTPKTTRSRIAPFVNPASPEEQAAEQEAFPARALKGAENSLERHGWWRELQEDLEIGRIPIAAINLLIATVILTLLVFVLLLSLTDSAILAVPALVLVPLAVRAWVSRKVSAQRRLFADQLGDALQVMASAMRAGHSFVAALGVAADQATDPMRTELRRVVAEERLGVPLDESLGVVVHRMRSIDLEQVGLVAVLQRESGGNTAEVLDRVTESIRDRADLRRLVTSLTAQGQISRWVVTLLPVGIAVAVTVINHGYLDPLVNTTLGKFLIVIGVLMITAGSMAIKRIVEIEI